jgi:hypothetical protein
VGVKSFAKTRTPPESEVAGGVSGTLIWWVYGGLCYEGSASANARVRLRFLTQRRARRVPGGLRPCWPGDLDGFGSDIAAHGWVAHRLNCVEFTNAEAMARGAIHRRFFLPHSSSVFRLMAGASAFFILSQSAYRFLLEGMNPARPGTIAAHLNVFYLRVSREQSMISSPGRVRVMKSLTRDRPLIVVPKATLQCVDPLISAR